MSVALIEPLVEMTATLNVVVSINSTNVMQIPEESQKMAKNSRPGMKVSIPSRECGDASRRFCRSLSDGQYFHYLLDKKGIKYAYYKIR